MGDLTVEQVPTTLGFRECTFPDSLMDIPARGSLLTLRTGLANSGLSGMCLDWADPKPMMKEWSSGERALPPTQTRNPPLWATGGFLRR